MIAIISLIVVYTLCCRGAWLFINRAHYHERGRWNNQQPDEIDILMTFIPTINTYLSIMYLLGGWKKEEYRTVNFFKKTI